MQDILLRATHEAQSIIVDCLNGYNYGQTYQTLMAHLQRILDKKDFLYGVKMETIKVLFSSLNQADCLDHLMSLILCHSCVGICMYV